MNICSWVKTFLVIIFFISKAQAQSLYTTVFNVIRPLHSKQIMVLSAADGRVYRMTHSEENLDYLRSLVGKVVRIDFDEIGEKLTIQNIQLAKSNEIKPEEMDLNHFQYNELRRFAPTDLKNLETGKEVFDGLINDSDKSISQCYKRAHMWAFDMWSQKGIFSEKVFIFWTRRYIDLEDFHWWFHVAPVVTVKGEKFVLDGTFMTKPVPVIEWKHYFIKSKKITCPTIIKYQDFSNNQWSRLCYLMIVPMYYYDPMSIERRDSIGEVRNSWMIEELELARKAFSNWMDRYQSLEASK